MTTTITIANTQAERARIERQVAGALRSTIDAHGPIDKERTGSAAKRVVAVILGGDPDNEARTTITEYRLPGKAVVIRGGDRVDVAPTQPGKHDGWVGTIITMFVDKSGPTAHVTHPQMSPRYIPLTRIRGRKR